MVDLHSHILPGLDDGAADLDESLEIARAAVADGIRLIAATPHVRDDYPTTPDAMEEGVAQLTAALKQNGIALELVPGGEIDLDRLRELTRGDLKRFTLGATGRYLLLETPYTGWPLSFPDIVFRATTAGFTPVIGHPERNAAVQQGSARLAELVQAGALVQITAASLDGRLGTRTRSCARRLLDAELVHLVGSDAHSAAVREVGLSRAVAEIGDEGLARWLTEDVPAAIVAGEDLPRRVPHRPRGKLARLLGR